MTANRETLTTRANGRGLPTANDGTPGIAYARWPDPATSDWIVFSLAAGGFGYRVAPDAPGDLTGRGSALTSSSGYAATRDLSSDFGGPFSMNSAINPDLHDAAHFYVPYVSSDLWSGDGAGTWANGGTTYQWQFRGMDIAQGAMAQLLADSRAADYSKILVYGRSAGAYGVLYNWPWLSTMAEAAGFEVYGVADGAAPWGGTPFNGADGGTLGWYGTETRRMLDLWQTPPSVVQWPFDVVRVVENCPQEPWHRFMVMACQTDTVAIEWHGVDKSSMTFASRQYCNAFAERSRDRLGQLPAAVNVWAPWYASVADSVLTTAHILCSDATYNDGAIMDGGQTPQQALSAFMAGQTLRVIAAGGEL